MIKRNILLDSDWTVYEQDGDTEDIGSAILVQENGAVLVRTLTYHQWICVHKSYIIFRIRTFSS